MKLLTESATVDAVLLLLQDVSPLSLTFSSAFAAGAMVYTSVDELISGVYAHGKRHATVVGVTIGVLAALLLMSLI